MGTTIPGPLLEKAELYASEGQYLNVYRSLLEEIQTSSNTNGPSLETDGLWSGHNNSKALAITT